jgi:hypothetical protein
MDFHATKSGRTASLRATFTVDLIDANGDSAPLETELSYDPSDPYAVTATFLTVAGRVQWTFGRDLLIEGMSEPNGDGDVHVWPCLDNSAHPVVVIELCSPDGEALVQVRAGDVAAFVERTKSAVPLGSESIDVDAAIGQILAEAG